MNKSNLVKDYPTRIAIKELEKTLQKVDRVPQLPANASLKEVIDTINKITNSLKRK